MSHSVIDPLPSTPSAYNGSMPSITPPAIAIVGAGPRGASFIERIGAQLRDRDPEATALALEIHVIDEAPSGAGRIWRQNQDRELCMNTLAHAVTLFTEHASTVEGPIHEGPTLYEWCVLALHAEFPSMPRQPR